ncbi:unnamed protein product [Spirodela intermedia]|uniref:Uncharacterized protein n=1 Tax=Spirodela intermedia TaxID=51605 RepID=A0A7I8LGW3_SPIIN|nr:unnamed protein product [Spirodela intermedia]
MVQHWRAMSFR